MGDSPLSRTPLPVPAYFRQADETFSLRRRGGAGLGGSGLTPRPPVKAAPPSSRLFPGRSRAWSQPRPLSVSARDAPSRSLSGGLYDESKSELYFEQCFLRLCRLGQGSFGEVFKVRSRVDGRLYAVKRSMELFRGEQDRWQKLEEARKHEGLAPHHNLVGFVSAWEERGRLYIQTELCEGSLQQRVEERGTLGEGEVWDVITDLLPALKHLHDRGVAHMDVKPANVFLSHAGVCKLGDFGLLLDTRERVRERATEGESERGSRGERAELSEAQEGDPRYMAPELLSGVYSRAADVFSLGMSILEICSNLELPRSGDGWQRLRQGYLPLEFVSGLSPSLLSILRLMLEPDPRRRASVDLLLSLPCVRRVRLYRRLRLLVREGLTQIIRVFQLLLSLLWVVWHTLTGGFLSAAPSPDVPPASPSPSSLRDPHSPLGWGSGQGHRFSDDVFPSCSQPQLPEQSTDTQDYRTLYSPETMLRPRMGSTSTPRNLSSDSLLNSRRSPRDSPNLSYISSESPCIRCECDGEESSLTLHEETEVTRAVFEPKNLLSLFEESIDLK
ncbi:membrane-associated tyrosine- and threonine-specific cdc2-inhibitory kinase [Callorhinchus milii]|uniref:membrane-associated tyrosine- and threonine-specific cdc2-inhibitory kinase n=1 Tax=Callorhinchus milii TaxID=7868 RepID=UPI001C3FAA36|nr:membrane-associated tyrosine- and threonine-specific cdc2-inhibitory kinase [Callorhinchus milii]